MKIVTFCPLIFFCKRKQLRYKTYEASIVNTNAPFASALFRCTRQIAWRQSVYMLHSIHNFCQKGTIKDYDCKPCHRKFWQESKEAYNKGQLVWINSNYANII